MKTYILYLITILALFQFSCTEKEIEVYNSIDYIYFTNNNQDSTIYSFSFHPGKTEDLVPVEVAIIGNLTDKDREFTMSVVDEETTASVNNYEFPEKFIFRANKAVDTAYIKVINSEELKTKASRIVFEITENNIFLTGPQTNIKAKIVICDMLSRPTWWDSSIEENFLGSYSTTKYRLFIIVAGVSDLTEMDESLVKAYSLKLKYYLMQEKEKGNIIIDEDGSPMEVTVIG